MITKHLSIYFQFGLALFILFGCVEESSRKGLPAISKITGETTQVDGSDTLCSTAYIVEEFICRDTCPNGYHIGDSLEVQEYKDYIQGTTASQETIEQVIANMEEATNVCIPGSGVLRPDNEVFIQSNTCACLSGVPDSIGPCEAYCVGKGSSGPTLYGSVIVGATIENNTDLGNLENWCNNQITGSDLVSPSCKLEVTAADGESQLLNLTIASDSNSFSANILTLSYEKEYKARIVENTSGSNVSSDYFHIYRKLFDSTTETSKPLKIMGVSQYTCITRQATEVSGNYYYEKDARVHFYYPANASPPSLPGGTTATTVCHDSYTHNDSDSPLYERLELIPQSFAVWDQSDVRFSDLNGDGNPDINETITEATGRSVNPFILLNWPNMPFIENYTSVTNPNVGFFMRPWLRPTGGADEGKAFCPTQDDYNGTDSVFKELKEIIGVDTEGIYMAEGEAITQADGSYVQDIIMIREGLLKKIWFYYENSTFYVPDSITANTKTTMFFYPPDEDNPYIRKPSQKIYTVQFPSSIGKQGSLEGLDTTIRPPDKRFGCIPALD